MQTQGHQDTEVHHDNTGVKQPSVAVSGVGLIQEGTPIITQQDPLARCAPWMSQSRNDAWVRL